MKKFKEMLANALHAARAKIQGSLGITKTTLIKGKDMLIEKRKIAIPVALVLVLVIGSISVYAMSNKSTDDAEAYAPKKTSVAKTETEEESETEPEDIDVTLDDLKPLEDKGILTGIKDLKIQEGTDIDLKSLIYVDNNIVKEVSVDDSKVDYNKAGTYEVTYTIQLDGDKLTEYCKSNDVKLSFDTDSKIVIIKITIKITIITEEEATEAVENGNPDVITPETKETVAESNKTQANNNGNTTAESSASTGSGNSNNNANSGNTNTGNSGSSTGSGDSSSNNNNSSSNNTSKEPETPAHSHTWVDHTTQVAREETYIVREWDEQVQVGSTPVYETQYQCSACGHTSSNRQSVFTHAAQSHTDIVQAGGSVSVNTGSTPIYETQHKIEYGTCTVYDTVVDYQYCSGCGAKK